MWLAIALHTNPEVPMHLAPEVAAVALGVQTDVLGTGLDALTAEQRAEVVAAHPGPTSRTGSSKRSTTAWPIGPHHVRAMNDDVLARFDPSFRCTDFVDFIKNAAWPG